MVSCEEGDSRVIWPLSLCQLAATVRSCLLGSLFLLVGESAMANYKAKADENSIAEEETVTAELAQQANADTSLSVS